MNTGNNNKTNWTFYEDNIYKKKRNLYHVSHMVYEISTARFFPIYFSNLQKIVFSFVCRKFFNNTINCASNGNIKRRLFAVSYSEASK